MENSIKNYGRNSINWLKVHFKRIDFLATKKYKKAINEIARIELPEETTLLGCNDTGI